MAKLASTRVYGNLVVDNALNIAGQLTSAVATGTAPFAVSSTTKVANLNADLLDGLHSDSAATVSTIAARTSNGYIYAVYFNSSNSAEATTASSYFYETGSDGFLRKKTLANVKTELVTSAAVIAGLGFTPYNATNPNNYISGINSSMVTSALGFTPYDSSNPNNYTSNSGTVTSVTAGTQVSGLTMTITNGSTTPSIATSISNAANFRSAIGAGTGNGTVTSVTGTTNHISVATGTTTPVISLATAFGDTINPYGAKAANLVLAGPASGGAAVPTFRTLVPADIPTLNQDTTGSALKLNVTDVRTIEDLDSYYELLPVQVTDKSVTSHFGYLSNAGAD